MVINADSRSFSLPRARPLTVWTKKSETIRGTLLKLKITLHYIGVVCESLSNVRIIWYAGLSVVNAILERVPDSLN